MLCEYHGDSRLKDALCQNLAATHISRRDSSRFQLHSNHYKRQAWNHAHYLHVILQKKKTIYAA